MAVRRAIDATRSAATALACAILSAAAAAQAPPAAQYRPPDAAEELAAETWLATHGHVLSGTAPTAAELRPIVARLAGASIIGVGEVTHGTHEDQAFKAALIEALVRADAVDTIAIEANRFAVAGFDRYVHGRADDLDALVRSDSFFRIWRTDEFADLLRWLREWNRSARHPVRLVGIDMQDGLRDADEALRYVGLVDPAAAAPIRARLVAQPTAPVGGRSVDFMRWSMSAPADRFAASRMAVDALYDWYERQAVRRSGDPDFAAGRDAARGARQAFAVAAPFNNADPSNLSPDDWQRRDRLMAENLLALTAGGHRVALWAHQGHVLADAPATIRQQGFTSLGIRVRDAIGPAYRTIGVTWSWASVLLTTKTPADARTMFPPADDRPAELVNDGPHTAGASFAHAAPKGVSAMWIDLGDVARSSALSGWRERALWKGEVGWAYDPATWQAGPVEENATPIGSGFDVLVWFRSMTPSHRWTGETH